MNDLDKLKQMCLRCMVKDKRDGELSHSLYFEYRDFIRNLINEEYEFMMVPIRESGIWSEEELKNITKETFLDAFFSVDK